MKFGEVNNGTLKVRNLEQGQTLTCTLFSLVNILRLRGGWGVGLRSLQQGHPLSPPSRGA